jgi:hypothetical protein
MSIYEVAILGSPTLSERQALTTTLEALVADFGLTIGREIRIHDCDSVGARDRRSACVAAYFGAVEHQDVEAARHLVTSSVPVIPTVGVADDFAVHIPQFLHATNGLRRRSHDGGMTELAISLLECVGLLRRQRRVFVSYRRTESRTAAMQIHDLMAARGFDVFLDTHSIRPGDPFQDVLWHRLCDSDVLVMLDTPTYFESRWTRQEIGRARAKDIHVLRVVWPAHTPHRLTDMAETIYLEHTDLLGVDGPVAPASADRIVLAVESVRSRSIAARYMAITGRLRVEAEKIGAKIEGIGAHRAISVRLIDDRRLWAFPVVGVPTAELLNDVAEKVKRAEQTGAPILVYDHIGIGEQWAAHLKWLDENIRSVRAVRVLEAGWTLAAWGE